MVVLLYYAIIELLLATGTILSGFIEDVDDLHPHVSFYFFAASSL